MKTSAADIAGHSSGAKLNFGALRLVRDSSPMKTHLVKLSGCEGVAEGMTAFASRNPKGSAFKPGRLSASSWSTGGRTSGRAAAPSRSCVVRAHAGRRDTDARLRFQAGARALPDGASIKCDGPFGDVTLHRDYFGAHTYEGVGAPRREFLHVDWPDPKRLRQPV